MNIFQRAAAAIEGFSEESLAYFKANVLPFLEKDAAALLTTVAPLAETAVLDAATGGKGGSAAFAQAVSDTKSAVIAAGLSASVSMLNFAVQTAYNKLNAAGALPTPAVPAAEPTPAATAVEAPAASPAAPVPASVPAPTGSNDADAPAK